MTGVIVWHQPTQCIVTSGNPPNQITVDLVLLWFPPQKKRLGPIEKWPPNKKNAAFLRWFFAENLPTQPCRLPKLKSAAGSTFRSSKSFANSMMVASGCQPTRKACLSKFHLKIYLPLNCGIFCGRSVDSCKIIYTDPKKQPLIWLHCLILIFHAPFSTLKGFLV